VGPENENLKALKERCQKTTRELEGSNRRTATYERDDKEARNLIFTMGEKTKRDRSDPKAPHASSYMGTWMVLSDNHSTVRAKVSAEAGHAHDLGLDIRSADVIGAMYVLAANVFSEIDNYSSPDSDIRR
jgi:hypothetical protein